MASRIKKALIECGALRYGDFTLASGKKSPYYVDIKKASTDPHVLEIIADEMARLIHTECIKLDRIAGVVLGSIPLAAALSLRTKIPFVMVRKEKKDHGTANLIEGALLKDEEVLMIEDVITSAGSVSEAIESVRSAGGRVSATLCVVDRQEGGEERLAKMGVKLVSLVTAEELLK
ncbi:MAG: orotate phosphoribosyltransferase [Euryarchaeota archaeon]|nr:orotate phosphoribosyltransferase [Euryarchaeota archaeon]